jgi:cytochrome P450
MRLHVSINILRELKQPVEIGGYHLKKGALLIAPTYIAHYDERSWGADEHPASEFWAERHVKRVKKSDESGGIANESLLSIASRSSSFFPFGGKNLFLNISIYQK